MNRDTTYEEWRASEISLFKTIRRIDTLTNGLQQFELADFASLRELALELKLCFWLMDGKEDVTSSAFWLAVREAPRHDLVSLNGLIKEALGEISSEFHVS